MARRAHLGRSSTAASRLDGWTLNHGRVLEKGVTGMRSFVVEPMQYGRLLPRRRRGAHRARRPARRASTWRSPTCACSRDGLVAWYGEATTPLLERYSADALRRVWRAEHFSWWMTSMLHRLESGDDVRRQAPARAARVRLLGARPRRRSPRTTSASSMSRSTPALLGAAVILTAVNLRTPVGSVPPVVDEIVDDVGLSAAAAGLLTTLPVLCFGLFAPASPLLARRLGAERVLLVALVPILVGLLVRSAPSTAALFAGTLLAGAGIAVGNVIVPAVLKGRFATSVGPLTGIYSAALGGGAALGAGLTVPIQSALGVDWRGALAFWAIPAALTDRGRAGGARARSRHHDRARRAGRRSEPPRRRARLAGDAVHGPAVVALLRGAGLAAVDSARRGLQRGDGRRAPRPLRARRRSGLAAPRPSWPHGYARRAA